MPKEFKYSVRSTSNTLVEVGEIEENKILEIAKKSEVVFVKDDEERLTEIVRGLPMTVTVYLVVKIESGETVSPGFEKPGYYLFKNRER